MIIAIVFSLLFPFCFIAGLIHGFTTLSSKTEENEMSKLKNFYTTGPDDFKPGDVFACVVALHYVSDYEDGTPEYRMYRCAYPDTQISDGIPQGQNIGLNEEIMQRLFPTAISVREMAKERT